MSGYLCRAKPKSAEEIADEMPAIMEDRERWIQKKSAQYYNTRYNEILSHGLEGDEGIKKKRKSDGQPLQPVRIPGL